jgi:hypothetical protein
MSEGGSAEMAGPTVVGIVVFGRVYIVLVAMVRWRWYGLPSVALA